MTGPRILLAASLSLSCAPAAPAQEGRYPVPLRTVEVEPDLAARAGALGAALDFAAWPRPADLYAPPPVGRALVAAPERLGEEVRSCTTVRLAGDAWPHCVWSWKRLGEGRKPVAADTLELDVTVAPSALAAQEYLLTVLADNMLTTQTLVALYRGADRLQEIGDAAFLVRSRDGTDVRLAFVRANVAVRLRGRGVLRDEVLALARRLDERLLAQQPLTAEQLRARAEAWRVETGAPAARQPH